MRDEIQRTYKMAQHDHNAKTDSHLSQADTTPFIAQRQLHQVLLHKSWDDSLVILWRAPSIPLRIGGKGFR